MKTPAAAMLWEFWKRGRGAGLAVVFLAALAGWVSNGAGRMAMTKASLSASGADVSAWESALSAWEFAAVVLMIAGFGLSIAVLLIVFSKAESHPLSGFSGIPPRMFVLPVDTRLLAGMPLACGSLAIVILHGVWFGIVLNLARFQNMPEPMPHLDLLLVSLSMFAGFSGTAWSLVHFPKIRTCVLCSVVVGSMILMTLPFVSVQAWSESRGTLRVILCGWLAVGLGLALFGPGQIRRGGWQGAVWMRRFGSRIRRQVALEKFTTSLSALQWAEFSRAGKLPLLIWILFVPLSVWGLLLIVGQSGGYGVLDHGFITVVLLVLGISFVVVVGGAFGSPTPSGGATLSAFVATQPVSVGDIVEAKLRGVLKALILGCGSLALAIVLFRFTLGQIPTGGFEWDLMSPVNVVVMVILSVASVQVALGFLPVWLSGRFGGFPWTALGTILAGGLLLSNLHAVERAMTSMRSSGSLQFVLVFLMVIKLSTAAVAFMASLRRGLIGPGFIVRWTGLWGGAGLACAALLAASGFLNGLDGDWPVLEAVSWLLLALPLARIALSPLALHWNRHR